MMDLIYVLINKNLNLMYLIIIQMLHQNIYIIMAYFIHLMINVMA